jgi:hypothetical protein
LQKQTKTLQNYNRQLAAMVRQQDAERARWTAQLHRIERNRRQILPLLERMVERLDQFLHLDLPFLPEERTRRLTRLRKLLIIPGISLAEKFRKVLEAYQIEDGYGRNLEAYRAAVPGDPTEMRDFLRLGRLALYSRSLDGSRISRWDPPSERWVPLGPEFRHPLKRALDQARNQIPPDLLWLPVPAPRTFSTTGPVPPLDTIPPQRTP